LVDAALRLSRFSARDVARERRGDDRRERRLREADAALRFVLGVALDGGAGSATPAFRAFERPIAIACLVERAPCFPSRT